MATLILLCLPNFILFVLNQDIHILLFSFLLNIVLFSLIRSTRYLWSLALFFLLIPVVIFYIYYYQNMPDENIIGIILETNIEESSQFIGNRIPIYLTLYFLYVIFICYFLYLNFKKPVVWLHSSRYWVLVIGSIYLISMFFLNQKISNQINQQFSENFLVVENNSFLQEAKQTYPFGMLISFYDLYKEQKKINQAFQHNANFKFNATSYFDGTQKQIYVLVIGETSRRANWSLNGYSRATNPQLSQQKNLVNFSNMLAISSATRNAVPMILTRKPAEQVYAYNFPEKSIISAFKEAGFRTYWLSTQQQFGNFDTSTSVYAKEADQVIFLNKANYTDAGEHDDVLIPVLNKIIHSNEQRQFIVIHTLGSHYNYAHRYPKEYDIFRPSLNDLSKYSLQELKYKQKLVNSYDNSILFTDHVLNNMIEILKQQKQAESFLFYSSDHGEDLFDHGCEKSGHGLDTQHNLEIASFAWYSDLFASQHPSQIAYLIQNKDRKINQTAIFPTLVQAAKIHIPEYTEEKSILSPFKDYPRLVLGGKNFDSAQYDKICKEIK